MTDADLEVERIAALAWRTFSEVAWSWPGDATLPDRWRDVARAVIADRAEQPPVTDGPTLMERTRQRDDARRREEEAVAERDALQSRLDDVTQERDALAARVERLSRITLEQESHLDALATREPTEAADRIAPTPAPIPLYVVFDGPPSRKSGRFVELETADGRGVGPIGSGATWTERDGLWRLGPLYGYAQKPSAPVPSECEHCGVDNGAPLHKAWCRALTPEQEPSAPVPTPPTAERTEASAPGEPLYEALTRLQSGCHQIDGCRLTEEECAAVVAELARLRAAAKEQP